MYKTVIGLFDNGNQAMQAIGALLTEGFSRESIRVLSNDPSERPDTRPEQGGTGSKLVTSLKSFLADIGLLNKEQHGVPQEHMRVYSEGVKTGKTLVMLYTDEVSAQKAANIMDLNGARNVDEGATAIGRVYDRPDQQQQYQQQVQAHHQQQYQQPYQHSTQPSSGSQQQLPYQQSQQQAQEGRVQSVEQAQGVSSGEPRVVQSQSTLQFEAMEPRFKQHWQQYYATSGYGWDYFAPAYRFGYDLANAPGYPDEWNAVEPAAKGSWESRNPGTWDRFKGLIKDAWQQTRSMTGSRYAQESGTISERGSVPGR